MSRKRLIKLAILLVALSPFVRAAARAGYSDTFNGFYSHPDYVGWVWSHNYGAVASVSKADYHITLSSVYGNIPGGDCALELRGDHIAHKFHHEPLPHGTSFTACNAAVGGYIHDGYHQRSVLCQIDASGFAAQVEYTPSPGCP